MQSLLSELIHAKDRDISLSILIKISPDYIKTKVKLLLKYNLKAKNNVYILLN